MDPARQTGDQPKASGETKPPDKCEEKSYAMKIKTGRFDALLRRRSPYQTGKPHKGDERPTKCMTL